MTEIRSDAHGPSSFHQVGGVAGATGPIKITIPGTTDVIEISTGTKGKKAIDAFSPELIQALFMMWFTGGSNPIVLQQLAGKGIEGIGALEKGQPFNFELFDLQVKNRLNEICIGVLDAWTKSVQEEGKAIRRKMLEDEKKAEYKEWQIRNGRAGYHEWLQQLSPEQRLHVDEFSRAEKLMKIDQGVQQGLRDYLTMIKTSTDPTISQDLPFITGALMIGGLHVQSVGTVDTVTTSQILIKPILEANNHAIEQVAPQDQAIALGYLGALMLTGASYQALGHTLASGKTKNPLLDHTFAQNYAQRILDIVDGKGLQTIAKVLISQSIEPGQRMNEERQVQLYKDVRIALLSTALALLYRTETSVKVDGEVIGGGIRSEEFIAMLDVNGSNKLLDTPLKLQLATKLRVLLEGNPDKDAILATVGAFIDRHKTSKDLIDIQGLFANITLDKGPNPMVVGG